MAAFKLDIQKQYGVFQQRVYAQGAAAPEHAGDARSVKDMVSSVKTALGGAGVNTDDTVIFRNIAYEDQDALLLAVRDAPY